MWSIQWSKSSSIENKKAYQVALTSMELSLINQDTLHAFQTDFCAKFSLCIDSRNARIDSQQKKMHKSDNNVSMNLMWVEFTKMWISRESHVNWIHKELEVTGLRKKSVWIDSYVRKCRKLRETSPNTVKRKSTRKNHIITSMHHLPTGNIINKNMQAISIKEKGLTSINSNMLVL